VKLGITKNEISNVTPCGKDTDTLTRLVCLPKDTTQMYVTV